MFRYRSSLRLLACRPVQHRPRFRFWHRGIQNLVEDVDTSGDGGQHLGDNNGLALPTFESRIFRVEDSIFETAKEIGVIKGEIGVIKGDLGTLKWQVGVLLALALGGSGSLLLYLVKLQLDNGNKARAQDGDRADLMGERILKVLQDMKAAESGVKESGRKA